MATVHLTLEQVNFDADQFPDCEFEDPISAVVDANIDFQRDTNFSPLETTPTRLDFSNKKIESNLSTRKDSATGVDQVDQTPVELPRVHEKFSNGHLQGHDRNATTRKNYFTTSPLEPSYPDISPEIAKHLYLMNPDIVSKAEAALNPDGTRDVGRTNIPGLAKSSLSYLANTSEAFAMQESVLAQNKTMATVHHKIMTTGNYINMTPPVTEGVNVSPIHGGTPVDIKIGDKTLHKFPPERITTVTERKGSWFTSDSNATDSQPFVLRRPPVGKQNIRRSSSRRSSVSSTSNVAAESVISSTCNDVTDNSMTSLPSRNEMENNAENILGDKSVSSRRSLDSRSICSDAESAYSDKFELDSNYSDLLETQSNVSEMSSVSGIEEEMYRIKKLLLEVPSLPDDHPDFHKHSVVFGRTGGVVVSDDCRDTHRIVVNQEVFFDLQREKANLEGQLETLKCDLDELRKEKNSIQTQMTSAQSQLRTQTLEYEKEVSERQSLTSKLKFVQEMCKKTESTNAQVQSNVDIKNNELIQLKEELRDLEEVNARLRIDSEELKVDLDSKEGAVQGLKSKIAELHVEAQLATQSKIQAQNEQEMLKSEMEALQKSREWFQQQLHGIQESRNKVQQEYLALQATVVSHKSEAERMRNESLQAKQQLTEVQQRAVKEKETLMRHLETIKADMLERESIFTRLQRDAGSTEESLITRVKQIQDEKLKLSDVALTVSDLEQQLTFAKEEISTKENTLKALEVNFAQTMKILTVAHKTVNEKNVEIQHRDEKCSQLEQKVKEIQLKLTSKDEQVTSLQNAKMAIEIALAAANKEKRDVDEALRVMRNNLQKIDASFRRMKSELAAKTASLEQVFREKQEIEEQFLKSEQKSAALEAKYKNFGDQLAVKDVAVKSAEENTKTKENELKSTTDKLHETETLVSQLRKDKEQMAKNHIGLQQEIDSLNEELKKTNTEKTEIEAQLENLLTSALASTDVNKTHPADDSDNSRDTLNSSSSSPAKGNQRTRRNSQDLSDGTKILKNPDKQSESYPRDALEREVILTRQALQAREFQIEKYLQEKKTLTQTVETLRKENMALLKELKPNGKSTTSESEQLNQQIEIQLQVYKRKVHELEQVLELTDAKRRTRAEIETQTDNVSFMKHVLEQDGNASSTEARLQALEVEHRERQRIYESNIKVLTRKLKEVMKAHKKAEVELNNWRMQVALNRSTGDGQGDCGNKQQQQQTQQQPVTAAPYPVSSTPVKSERDLRREILHYRAKVKGQQIKLADLQKKYDEMKSIAEANKETTLQLEKEKGKLTGVSQSNLALKQQTTHLQAELVAKENVVSELDMTTRGLNNKQREEEERFREYITQLERELATERETAKELRKQIFNAKRESSGLRKQVGSLRTGLDNANVLVDSKKNDIVQLNLKLHESKAIEMKLIGECDALNSQWKKSFSEAERLKELGRENQTKDDLLAEQIKNMSWHLRQEKQQVSALKEQMTLAEERQRAELEGIKRSLQMSKAEVVALKEELEETMKQKFHYQSQVTELRSAIKSMRSGSSLELSIPESPLPYDETHVLSLLEQSALPSNSRPLSNLQSCLNTLKLEMKNLQEQLNEQQML